MRLANKVAIVTGSASGMGAAIARVFAREGAQVVVADVLEKEGAAVAAEIGPSARFMKLDVTSEENWEAVVGATVRDLGKLDILVNNAGISGNSVTDLYSTEGWHKIISINATGVFLGIKHAVAAMMGKGGAIVNMSSINGFVGSYGAHMAYHASKGGVRLMTKTVAVQHAKDGIRCNSVHPGTMPPMRTAIRSRDPVVRAEMIKNIPMGRAGEVEEVANAVLFLASDEASYITGTELVVDGGSIAI